MPVLCVRCGSEISGRVKFCLNCGERIISGGSGLVSKYYDIHETLKMGMSGMVFRATDTQFGTQVALKKVVSSRTESAELEAEKRRFNERVLELARLRHPGLPEILDSFVMKDPATQQSCYYIARAYVEGSDLVTLMEERGGKPLPVDETLDCFRQMLEIFNYLHKRLPPVQFRNVTPANFIIRKEKVYFVDFGISQAFWEPQKKLVIVSGYSAGGDERNSAVSRELYSIAVAVHFLLTGKTPDESRRQSFRRLNPNVPEHLDKVLISMLDLLSSERPRSVEEVLERLCSPVTQCSEGGPSKCSENNLFAVIEDNDVACVARLIARGVDINEKDGQGDTPLFRALFEGREEIAKMLIKAGADINFPESIGSTLLHWAVSMDMKQVAGLLLERGIDVNRADSSCSTPLHIAASRDLPYMVSFLIAHDARVDAVDQNQLTPLHNAAMKGSSSVVEILLAQGASVKARDCHGNTPLHKVAYLLDWAVQTGHRKVGEMLIEKGADIDAVNDQERTPLHEAAETDHGPIAGLLISRGAAIGLQDINGKTPFLEAVLNGHLEIAVLLIERGADVNERDKSGNTPLHWASYKGFLALVGILIAHGAEVNAEDLAKNGGILALSLNQPQSKGGLKIKLTAGTGWQTVRVKVKGLKTEIQNLILSNTENKTVEIDWISFKK